MKKIIHVNQHNIKYNRKNSCNAKPVITVKTYKGNTYCDSIEILGPSKLVYSPDKPLKCGAVCYLLTESEVKLGV